MSSLLWFSFIMRMIIELKTQKSYIFEENGKNYQKME